MRWPAPCGPYRREPQTVRLGFASRTNGEPRTVRLNRVGRMSGWRGPYDWTADPYGSTALVV
ncbi:hypothetical protein GCM10027187_17960 [Streptosporangium sandarakinum]